MKQKIKILIVVFFCFISSYTHAQHAKEEHGNETEHSQFHTHHIALFNGVASNFTHHSTHYSLGIDYEYRFSQFIGTGLIGEYVAVEKGEFLGGIPVFIHFTKGLKLTFAPLLINNEEHTGDNHHTETNRVTNFAFRMGAGYSFHLGKVSLGPSVNFDMGDSNSLIYGLSVGIGF
ncbi:MAG: hypothetical protein ACQER7_06650 [Bacteroidota bacterium]